ncbi:MULTISPECIES: hypothetical protein [unclassified Nocardiopsis]|uniref:hypothetical protein n=1 Tax=Nocardiopsis TaxID=2013 RepID=UPI00387B3DB1
MDKDTALAEAKAAHDAIVEAEAEAKRLVEEARINFGRVTNKLVDGKHVLQEDIAAEVGKTREYVRRLQVKARKA